MLNSFGLPELIIMLVWGLLMLISIGIPITIVFLLVKIYNKNKSIEALLKKDK